MRDPRVARASLPGGSFLALAKSGVFRGTVPTADTAYVIALEKHREDRIIEPAVYNELLARYAKT